MVYIKDKKVINVCKLIAFGDSHTDTANAFIVSKKVLSLPNPPAKAVLKPIPGSWCKRASNGLLSIEVLANLLNVPLYNYSIGGAGTNAKNIFYWLDTFSNTGFLGQVSKYIKDLNGCKPCPNDLYSIFIGANTTTIYRPPTFTLDESSTLGVRDIKLGMESLIKIGANNFVVFNLFNLALLPYSISKNLTKEAKEFTVLFNQKLKVMLNELKSKNPHLKIIEFDLYALINDIVANKDTNKYNITNIDTPCHPSDPNSIPQKYYPFMGSNCLFWDDYHVTRIVNEITGNQLYQTLLTHGFY